MSKTGMSADMGHRTAAGLVASVSLLLTSCGSAYDSNNALVGVLQHSGGHSACANARLGTLLDRYGVLEVIPDTRDCRGGDVSQRAKTAATGCAVPITKVRFQASTARTATIDQDGWVSSGDPVRIERSMTGAFSVYVPDSMARANLDAGECGVFERRIRQGLSGHISYLRAIPQNRTAQSTRSGSGRAAL